MNIIGLFILIDESSSWNVEALLSELVISGLLSQVCDDVARNVVSIRQVFLVIRFQVAPFLLSSFTHLHNQSLEVF